VSTWPRAALGDVAEIQRDTVDPSTIESGTIYVGLENIQSGGEFIGVRSVDAGELASSKFAFSSRHLLFGKLRPYLAKIARPDFSGICSTDILPVLPGPRLDRNYLANFLLTPAIVALATSRATGANLPRLSPHALAELSVPLPPLAEQLRIADVLDRAGALRVKRRVSVARLAFFTQALFLDTFGDPATNLKKWPMTTLGDLISVGPQNGLYKPASDYGTGTPILRIDAFYDGTISDLASLKRVRISDEEQDLYGLRSGQIVINRVNSREYLGKSALIPALSEPTVFESNMMRFDVHKDRVQPLFVIQYLQTEFVRSRILQSAKDAINQSSINQQDVRAIPVFVPPMAIQEQFAQRLGATVRLEALHQGSLTELDRLFESLQNRFFMEEL
jgi:type I restriction enzyme, S subunit